MKNFRNSLKSILIVGGLGTIGSKINDHYENENIIPYVLDTKKKILGASLEKKKGRLLYFENENIFQVDGNLSTELEITFDTIIFAVRYRNNLPATFVRDLSNETLDDLSLTLNITLIQQLQLLQVILKKHKNENGLSVIFIYSSNAKEISHQSLGYHVANAAIEQACKYISVHFASQGVRIFPVQIGAINTDSVISDEINTKVDSKPLFQPVTLDELMKLIQFLSQDGLEGLSGSPIVLTKGRSNMDVTAAYEGVFGNLGVRKSLK